MFCRAKLTLFALLCVASLSNAQSTYNAATCAQADVQTAVNSRQAAPVSGDIINIPAGSCTWTGGITPFSTATSLTIQGQSSIATTNADGNVATFNDATSITDGASNSTKFFDITLTGTTAQVVRFTGLTLIGAGSTKFNGYFSMGQSSSAAGQMRVDHCHLKNLSTAGFALFEEPYGQSFGVVDHNFFENNVGSVSNGVQIYENGVSGAGHESWTNPSGFGTFNFIYFENNTWNNGFMNDCKHGGRYVARFNTFNATGSTNMGIQSHAFASDGPGFGDRGCRAWEAYGNKWHSIGGGSLTFSTGFQTAGAGLWHENTIDSAVTPTNQHDLAFVSDRDNNGTYTQNATPGGVGYCGSTFNGTASGWDGQQTVASGYPCMDNPGRGRGDLVTGTPPSMVNNTTTTIAWPHQQREPVYMWNESFSGTGSLVTVTSANANITSDRDYYLPSSGVQISPTSPFNGTTGTGWGTLANRPTTCTAGPGGTFGTSPTGSYGVAYWATDQSILYVCTAANTWTNVYTPYTYPHPLVSSGSGGGPAATPSFSPAGGAYLVSQTVTISTATAGAIICYNTTGAPATNGLGTACTTGSTLYSGPVTVAVSETLFAVAGKSGLSDSSVGSAAYVIGVAPPSTLHTISVL